MKTKIIQIGIFALMVVLLAGLANAQVCDGILSAPTKMAYVDEDIAVNYFNAEDNSTGANLTLHYPPNVLLISGDNPIVGINNFTNYSWVVNVNQTGIYPINVTIDGSANCTSASFVLNITEPADAPFLLPVFTGLTTVIKGDSANFNLNITNYAGDAYDVSGHVASASLSPITPDNQFSFASILNGTSGLDTYTITPGKCGIDSLTAHISNIKDGNGYPVSPVDGNPYFFTVVGSDVTFTSMIVPSDVTQGGVITFQYYVKNVGTYDTTNVIVETYIDNVLQNTENLGNLMINFTALGSFAYTASISEGVHSVRFVVNSDRECDNLNNEASTTFQVGNSSSAVCGNTILETGEECDGIDFGGQTCTSLGFVSGTLNCNSCTINTSSCVAPSCGDGICNGGETSSTCSADCGSPSSSSGGGSGGGGSGGSGAGKIYILELTPENPIKSLVLRNGDTVKYFPAGTEDYSFLFRNIYKTKSQMGISKADGYESYSFYTGNDYNLNLDKQGTPDLKVTPIKTYNGYGNFTFELINFESVKKPIITLPVKKVKEPTPVDLGTEPVKEPVKEEEALSEGVLEFVETLNVRNSAPIWAGLLVAAIIILLGTGAYFLATKNRNDDRPLSTNVKEKKLNSKDKKSAKLGKNVAKTKVTKVKPIKVTKVKPTKIKIGKKL